MRPMQCRQPQKYQYVQLYSLSRSHHSLNLGCPSFLNLYMAYPTDIQQQKPRHPTQTFPVCQPYIVYQDKKQDSRYLQTMKYLNVRPTVPDAGNDASPGKD